MRRFIACSLIVISLAVSTAFAQGPLAPAGAPGPVMKTLDQVEARTPITSLPMTISAPGSYYLTAPLSITSAVRGINIESDDVTIDLNGFSLNGTNGTTAIYVKSTIFSNIVIRNGSIEGWMSYGIDGNAADNLMVRDVQVRKTGDAGIRLGMNSIVANCQVMDSVGGIEGYIGCAVRNCQVMNIFGNGIDLNNGALVENSQAANCTMNGIYVGNDSLVKNCTVMSNEMNGISVGLRSAVLDNLCTYNALDGTSAHILSRSNETRIARNQLGQTAGTCIRALGSYGVIADNVVLDFRATSTYDLSRSNSINILIHRLPVFLDWPCNAKVMGSLSGADGIFIQSDDVTLDLGGHTLTGTDVNPGVRFRGYSQVTVKNGTLKNWILGIDGRSSTNCTLENVKIIGNNDGADLGPAAHVSHCTFSENAGYGLQCAQAAQILDSQAYKNGRSGIIAGMGSQISRCVAR
ncbi:MAG: right-handed parallel beta-helix repeat-containing protein, partial [Kiritimatiellae bacterium]|nr:right-handed parallel beta-helix repeat-containing protein [Kiritimatiellia bacterium]